MNGLDEVDVLMGFEGFAGLAGALLAGLLVESGRSTGEIRSSWLGDPTFGLQIQHLPEKDPTERPHD